MTSYNESEGFAPKYDNIALVQGIFHSEASIATHDNGECVSDVPGSQVIAGHSTVHSRSRVQSSDSARVGVFEPVSPSRSIRSTHTQPFTIGGCVHTVLEQR